MLLFDIGAQRANSLASQLRADADGQDPCRGLTPPHVTLPANLFMPPTQYASCSATSVITHHMAQFRPSSSHQDYGNSFLTILHVCPSLSELNLVPSSKPSDGSHSPYNNVQVHCLRVFSLDVCPCSRWAVGFEESIYLLWASVALPHSVATGKVAQVVHCTSVPSGWRMWKLKSSPCSNHQMGSLVWAESESGQKRKLLSLICPKVE